MLSADGAPRPLAEQRKHYDEWSAAFRARRPAGVVSEDLDADGVPVRLYSVGNPTCTVVYCHGGGFIFGGLDSHDDVCAEVCAQTGYRVVAVDYRLAPEHPHPVAFDDSWRALQWVKATYHTDLVLMGDSAGATLCAAMAHKARGTDVSILGQVLVYPLLGQDTDTASYRDHMSAPLLTRDDIIGMLDLRGPAQDTAHDVTYAPLNDINFKDLPPTVAFSADCDPLRDDAHLYVEKLQQAAGQAKWINEVGLVHSYLRARHSVRRASESFERITLAVEALGQGVWSWD
nr:alpha/beta hydrolase fold domain-containing protein [Epibacterium ulvae]